MTLGGESATLARQRHLHLEPRRCCGFLAGRLGARPRPGARGDGDDPPPAAGSSRPPQRAAFENEKLAAIGRLAAGIAHEVRNPLGVIRASAAMVQEHFARARRRPPRLSASSCEEIDRLDGADRVAARLRAADGARAARRRASATVVERASRLAAEVARRARRHAAPRSSRRRDGPTLRVDPELVAQLLLGLVTNAAEALAPGGTHRAARARERDGAVVLAVADDGPGVPEAERERIFEPFYTTKASGTGLGLAMAERIARAHGGELRAGAGRGRRPAAAAAPASSCVLPAHGGAARRDPAHRGARRRAAHGRDPRDGAAARAATRCAASATPEAALAALAAERFDLLLTDLRMPGPRRPRRAASACAPRTPSSRWS